MRVLKRGEGEEKGLRDRKRRKERGCKGERGRKRVQRERGGKGKR